jgi:cell shape-determining protein MreC
LLAESAQLEQQKLELAKLKEELEALKAGLLTVTPAKAGRPKKTEV